MVEAGEEVVELLELGAAEFGDAVAGRDHVVEDGVGFVQPEGAVFEELGVEGWAEEEVDGGDEEGF